MSPRAEVRHTPTQLVESSNSSHWQTGAAIGAVVGVAAMVVAVGAGGGPASLSEILLLGGIGILLGGVPGALIGALFPK